MEQAIVNWAAVAALSEAFGAIAVAASLVFVGFQIHQSAQATRAASMNNIMDKRGEFYLRYSENENLAEIVWTGVQDAKALSGIDRWRFSMALTGVFHNWHNDYYQWTIGAYESKAWSAQAKFMINLLSLPGARAVWDERKLMLPKNFQMYVETEILTKSPDPDYQIPGT